MVKLYNVLLRIAREVRGQDLVEYSLLIGLVATATGASFPGVADSFSTIFNRAASLLMSAGV